MPLQQAYFFMSKNSAKKRSSKTVPNFSIFSAGSSYKLFQSGCIPFILQLTSWIEIFQFIDYLLHSRSRSRLSLQASPHQATKHTIRYKHDLFVTPSRIWKLSDAHFAKKNTKAVDINLTTIKNNLRTSIFLVKIQRSLVFTACVADVI